MPVPNSLTDLSVAANANSPQGTESAKGTIDDYLRTAFAFIAQVNQSIASALTQISGKANSATTLAGYGITDALPLAGGTMTGQLLLKEGTASVPALSFNNDGAPDTGLYHISDGVFGITCNTNDTVRFSSGNVAVYGTISATTVTQTSDERKKKRWQRLPGDFIAKLAGIQKAGTFQWKKTGEACVGIGAQSLEAILPAAVYTDEHGGKTVNAGGAALAILPELARELIRLRARVEQLEAR